MKTLAFRRKREEMNDKLQHETQNLTSLAGVILSAGKGTRMRGLSNFLPKPLLPLCGPSLIEWSIQRLQSISIEHIGVNTYHLSEQLKQALTSHRLVWSDEHILQGTGGGTRDVWRALEQELDQKVDTMLILNGDAWFDFSLAPLLQEHRSDPWRQATLCLRETTPDDPFGRIGLNQQHEVVRIAEIKGPKAHEEVKVAAFLGAQIVNRTLIEAIPEGPCDLFRSAYKALFAQDAYFAGYLIPKPHIWADVGTPERYLALHQTILEKYLDGSLHPDVIPQLPTFDVKRSVQGGLIAAMEGAIYSTEAQVKNFVWLYPKAELTKDSQINSAILWPQSTSSSSILHKERTGIYCQQGYFVDADGSTEEGAVGAQ